MKKIFLLLIFMISLYISIFAEPKKLDCVTILKDNSASFIAGTTRIDTFLKSKVNVTGCLPKESFKINSGALWVRAGSNKITVDAGNASIEASNAIFMISKNIINVYKGYAVIKRKGRISRAGRSMSCNLVTGKMENIGDNAEGEAKAQIDMDKFSVLCEINAQTADYIDIRKAFEGGFSAFYHPGKVLFSFDNPKEDYDLILSLNKIKKDKRVMIEGSLKNRATGEVISFINADEKDEANLFMGLITKVAIETGRAIDVYGSKVLAEGTTVFIEAEGYNTEKLKEIKGIIEKFDGVKEVKESEFYGQKGVFEVKYAGNGYDLAANLKVKKIENKWINVWKYSKFVVKLDNR